MQFVRAGDRNGGRVRLLGEPQWPLSSQAGVREWARHEAVIKFEVTDSGAGMDDPIAGQLASSAAGSGGRGLWTARLLCDSVEFRRDPSGATVTLHVTLPDPV